MDLGSAISVLLRRWLVVLVGIAMTTGAGYYIYTTTPPNYQATARMLLLLPSDAQSRGDEVLLGSPFLYLPQGLNILAQVAVSSPASLEFRDMLEAKGLPSDFEVAVDHQQPIISVSIEGHNPDNVITTRDEVLRAIEAELLHVQEDARTPPRQLAYPKVYASADTPEHMSGSGLRGVLAVVAVGGLVTLVAAFTVDRLIQVWRRRRVRRAADEGEHATDGNAAIQDPTDQDPTDQDPTDQDLGKDASTGSGSGSP